MRDISFITSLNIQGGNIRVDCPTCGGGNTLGVSRRRGKVVWHCFRANCKERGAIDQRLDVEDIKKLTFGAPDAPPRPFQLPATLVSWDADINSIKFCETNNVIPSIEAGRADVRYDPEKDRTIFIIKDETGKPIDAVGRAMNKEHPSKWYRYGATQSLFVVKSEFNTSSAVIVEDAASACAISCVCTGVALMGTELASMGALLEYSRVYLALDPDAMKKNIELAKHLSYWCDAKVVAIPDDLKYYNDSQLKSMFKEWSRNAKQ